MKIKIDNFTRSDYGESGGRKVEFTVGIGENRYRVCASINPAWSLCEATIMVSPESNSVQFPSFVTDNFGAPECLYAGCSLQQSRDTGQFGNCEFVNQGGSLMLVGGPTLVLCSWYPRNSLSQDAKRQLQTATVSDNLSGAKDSILINPRDKSTLQSLGDLEKCIVAATREAFSRENDQAFSLEVPDVFTDRSEGLGR